MYTPQGLFGVSGFLNNPSAIMPSLPLDKPSRFSLDTAGVASLLGGDDVISAMTAVLVYGNQRALGWYNNPGSFQVARRLNSLATSAFFHNIVGGTSVQKSVHVDPTALIGLDSCKGPKFQAAQSGTIIEETGIVAALFMKECATWDSDGKVVPGRRTQPVSITIADLGKGPAFETRPARSSASAVIFASIPIIASVMAGGICALYEDWYASGLIFVGIIASGVSGLVLGSADFVFTHPEPAKGSPAGDGILTSDKNVVLLRGAEGAVNSITRGQFALRFAEGHYNLIRWCSFLFLLQSFAQLFLIPQASLFGQVMFLASLAVSALYNARLSSSDKEKIHRKMLFERVLENPTMSKYTLGTRTSAVVFILLVLQPANTAKLLDELLPNDTRVWAQWKSTILEWLRRPNDQTFQVGGKDMHEFSQKEKDLLGLLLEDARAAYIGYQDYLGSM